MGDMLCVATCCFRFASGEKRRLKRLDEVEKGGCLGYGSDFWHVLPVFRQDAFAFVVSAEFVDFCFEEDHVAFVVGVFLVFVHVDCHALGFFDEVCEVFWHGG